MDPEPNIPQPIARAIKRRNVQMYGRTPYLMNFLQMAPALLVGLVIQGCSKPMPEKAAAVLKERIVSIDEQMPQEAGLLHAIKELSKSLSSFQDTRIQIRFRSFSGGYYQSIGYRRDHDTLYYALDAETGADLYWNDVPESLIHSIAKKSGNMPDFGHPDITTDIPSTRAATDQIGLTTWGKENWHNAQDPDGRAGSVRAYEQNGPSNTVERTDGEQSPSNAQPPAPKP